MFDLITKLKIVRAYWPVSRFYFRHLFSRTEPLLGLFFQVTNKCNARCQMCFNWQKLNEAADELTLGEIEKITFSLGSVRDLTLSGGEPVLRADLPGICALFIKNCGTRKIAVPTNCLLPDKLAGAAKEIMNYRPAKLKFILSLDGVGEVHDKIRGVPGAFSKVLETYERLNQFRRKNQSHFSIGVNTTVSLDNCASIPEVIRYVDDNFDADSHTVETIRGCYNKEEAQAVPPSDYRRLIPEILRSRTLARKNVYNKVICSYYHRLALKIMEQKKRLIICRASSFLPVIDEKGNVYNCELLPPIGNLRECGMDFMRIWHSPQAKRQRKDVIGRKCFCTHSCYQLRNIVMSPSHFWRALCEK